MTPLPPWGHGRADGLHEVRRVREWLLRPVLAVAESGFLAMTLSRRSRPAAAWRFAVVNGSPARIPLGLELRHA